MQPDVALNEEYKNLYPFSKIVGNANILIMLKVSTVPLYLIK